MIPISIDSEDNLCVVLQKKLDFVFETRPIPTCEKNDVLLRVKSVGLCGSDVHYWHEGRCGRFVVTEPIILGHESSAEVVGVGENVSSLQLGDKVAIEPGVPCRKCSHCKIGRYNLCKEIRFHATPPVDGTLAKFITHPADFCFKMPSDMSYEEGALLEPFSVAVYGCQRSNVDNGTTVLICGAGPIGLASLITAKSMGCGKVAITDVSPTRLAYAKQLGADHCELVGLKEKTEEEYVLSIHTGLGQEPEACIECAGPESSIRLAIKAVKARGSIATVGRGCMEPKIPITEIITKEININGVFRYANCFPMALAIIRSGSVPVESFITHKFSLEETEQAFHMAHSGQGVKVIVNVS